MREFWAETGSEPCQNKKSEYPESRLEDGNRQVRYFPSSLFSYVHKPTQTKFDRSWLCYSDSANKIFCFHCTLFASGVSDNLFSCGGFNDWKNVQRAVTAHEKSADHLESLEKYVTLQTERARIDESLLKQYNAERMYWRSVLQRVVAVIKRLSERGLAFRGDDELIDSPHNGNFLGTLELIAQFDPFLAGHLEKQRALQEEGRGRGTVSYLSSTICDELIQQMGSQVLSVITDEIKAAKYYSISIDSTPDASKVDRVTCIVRYMPIGGVKPVERFMKFLGTEGHTAQQLADTMTSFLVDAGVDLKDCRGQSFDNASNMAGKYNGVQALIKRENPQAVFIPCFGHSTNLVGTEAANCVPKATAFFDFVQKLYAFFSASPQRWKIFTLHVPDSPTLKSLSQTRWSARNDALNALYSGYAGIMDALESVKDDANEKPEVRLEATGLVRKMEQLEYGILTCFWQALLNRFNSVTTALQSPHLDLNNAVDLMRSLCEYVAEMRGQFDFYEEQGRDISGCQDYKEEVSRKRIRSKRLARFEGAAAEADLSPKEKFRVETYLAVIDTTSSELTRRLEAYSTVCARFGFLHKLMDLDSGEIREFANALVEAYPDDLDRFDFADELIQFAKFARKHVRDKKPGISIELQMYIAASAPGICETFPNVNVALHIYLCMLVITAAVSGLFLCCRG